MVTTTCFNASRAMAVAGLLAMTLARADDGLPSGVHRVVDANGVVVGEYVPTYDGGVGAYTQINGIPLTIPLTQVSRLEARLIYTHDEAIRFSGHSCTGTAILGVDRVGMGRPVVVAKWHDRRLLFVADSLVGDSSGFHSALHAGHCVHTDGNTDGFISTSEPIDITDSFKVPFTVR